MKFTLSKLTAILKQTPKTLPNAYATFAEHLLRLDRTHRQLAMIDAELGKASAMLRAKASDPEALAAAHSALGVLLGKRTSLENEAKALLDGPRKAYDQLSEASNAAMAFSEAATLLQNRWWDLPDELQKALVNNSRLIEWHAPEPS